MYTIVHKSDRSVNSSCSIDMIIGFYWILTDILKEIHLYSEDTNIKSPTKMNIEFVNKCFFVRVVITIIYQ